MPNDALFVLVWPRRCRGELEGSAAFQDWRELTDFVEASHHPVMVRCQLEFVVFVALSR